MRVGVATSLVMEMGGRVGLKGTDGRVAETRAHGVEPRSPEWIRRTLSRLFETAPEAELFAWGGEMGAAAARDAGFDPEVLGEPSGDGVNAVGTVTAAETFVDADADLVLFVGGDGIAADVAGAPNETDVPMLGVPAGVKVHSSVFAISPEDVVHVITSPGRTGAREIMDINEGDYRDGKVRPELWAAAHIPVAEDLQLSEQTSGGTVESLATGVAGDIRSTEGVTYVLGPGSTVGVVKAELGTNGSPFGVDAYRDGEVFARNATEAEILTNLDTENVIVITPVGGQGFVPGCGNPQLSPVVIQRYDASVATSRSKFDGIPVLRADADDPDLDADLCGWTKVRVGRVGHRMVKTE